VGHAYRAFAAAPTRNNTAAPYWAPSTQARLAALPPTATPSPHHKNTGAAVTTPPPAPPACPPPCGPASQPRGRCGSSARGELRTPRGAWAGWLPTGWHSACPFRHALQTPAGFCIPLLAPFLFLPGSPCRHVGRTLPRTHTHAHTTPHTHSPTTTCLLPALPSHPLPGSSGHGTGLLHWDHPTYHAHLWEDMHTRTHLCGSELVGSTLYGQNGITATRFVTPAVVKLPFHKRHGGVQHKTDVCIIAAAADAKHLCVTSCLAVNRTLGAASDLLSQPALYTCALPRQTTSGWIGSMDAPGSRLVKR